MYHPSTQGWAPMVLWSFVLSVCMFSVVCFCVCMLCVVYIHVLSEFGWMSFSDLSIAKAAIYMFFHVVHIS